MAWLACARCKEPFMLHPETEAMLRRSAKDFHCPWGHEQHFPLGPTEADTLRQERDRLKQNAAYLEDRNKHLREQAQTADRRAAAARGQVTKLKNRAAAGLCPCCNRSFTNLQRHMATKHAGFLAEEVQEREGITLQ